MSKVMYLYFVLTLSCHDNLAREPPSFSIHLYKDVMYQYILLRRGKIRFADGNSLILELIHHCILSRRTMHESDMGEKMPSPAKKCKIS